LKDFDKTEYNGLYISKMSHPTFGKKYIARFQLNRKRYMKVLGYDKKDNLTIKSAYKLLEKYRQTLQDSVGYNNIATNITPKQKQKKQSTPKHSSELNVDDKILQEYNLMKDILGNYESLSPETLALGIQKIYDLDEIKPYQVELIKLQKYLEQTKKKMIILFEGRDASGKGGAIRRITRFMNSRHYRVVALGKPTETQKYQWFFQKYIEHFPTGGEMVLFDRSWYNRAMVEPIFGFCSDEQYEIFMEDVVNFEQDLVRDGMILVKLYFSVSKEEQQNRFDSRMTDPLKQWKLSEVDLQAQDLWDEFSEKKYEMLKRTHSRSAPWNIVRSDSKHLARLEALKIILNSVDYDNRNYSLDFEPNEKINISVQKELSLMRKNKNY
jgi:polyphosphate kinase 2